MKPSDFTSYPWASVLQSAEAEIVAHNTMKILARTGNEFRLLEWEEYREHRLNDRGFSEKEKSIFEKVVSYCESADKAVRFSKSWAKKPQ